MATTAMSRSAPAGAPRASTRQLLRHVMVVGGTLRDWHLLGAERWERRVADLGRVADEAGASYVTIRALEIGAGETGSGETGAGETGSGATGTAETGTDDTGSSETGADDTGAVADGGPLERWQRVVGGCTVIVDPCGDGRQRFADALAGIELDEPVNEATVAEALYAPADYEPDLIVVLGPSTRLPPSLVWELAYGELVFHPMAWDELAADHLVDAIADFARRERRFGGIDPLDDV